MKYTGRVRFNIHPNDAGTEAFRDEYVSYLLDLLEVCYRSGNRDGWQDGPTTDETMEAVLDCLANAGRDPHKTSR